MAMGITAILYNERNIYGETVKKGRVPAAKEPGEKLYRTYYSAYKKGKLIFEGRMECIKPYFGVTSDDIKTAADTGVMLKGMKIIRGRDSNRRMKRRTTIYTLKQNGNIVMAGVVEDIREFLGVRKQFIYTHCGMPGTFGDNYNLTKVTKYI